MESQLTSKAMLDTVAVLTAADGNLEALRDQLVMQSETLDPYETHGPLFSAYCAASSIALLMMNRLRSEGHDPSDTLQQLGLHTLMQLGEPGQPAAG